MLFDVEELYKCLAEENGENEEKGMLFDVEEL
jgi:hypothetical protein